MLLDPVSGVPLVFLDHLLSAVVREDSTWVENVPSLQEGEYLVGDLADGLVPPLRVPADWKVGSKGTMQLVNLLPTVDIMKSVYTRSFCDKLGVKCLSDLKCFSSECAPLCCHLRLVSGDGDDKDTLVSSEEVFQGHEDDVEELMIEEEELLPTLVTCLTSGLDLMSILRRRRRLVLEVPEWETELSKQFLMRQRIHNWPSEEMLQRIAALPVSLVRRRESSSDNSRSLEFCVSYHNQMIELASYLTARQKQCYLLVRLAMEAVGATWLHSSHKNSLSPLKHALFWTVEQSPPSIWNQELAVCFFHFLDKVLHWLVERNLPCYFESRVNLLAEVSQTSITVLSQRILEVRRAPVDYFFGLSDYHHFVHLPLSLPCRKLFSQSMTYLRNCAKSLDTASQQELKNKLASDYLQSCVLYLEETFFFKNADVWVQEKLKCALEMFTRFCTLLFADRVTVFVDNEVNYIWCLVSNMLRFKSNRFEVLEDNLLMVALQCDGCGCPSEEDRFFVLSELVRLYSDNCSKDSLSQSNMVCLQAVLLHIGGTAAGTVNKVFQRSCAIHPGNFRTLIKYACHLLTCEDYSAVLQVCKKAYSLSCNDFSDADLSKQTVSFKRLEYPLLDKHLKNDFDYTADKEIIYPVKCWIHYLLILAYVFTSAKEESNSILQRFVSSEKCSGDCATPCNLLGYAFLHNGDYSAAKSVFDEILEKSPDNSSAYSTLELCTALMLSIEE